jgi:hypothetical protein
MIRLGMEGVHGGRRTGGSGEAEQEALQAPVQCLRENSALPSSG